MFKTLKEFREDSDRERERREGIAEKAWEDLPEEMREKILLKVAKKEGWSDEQMADYLFENPWLKDPKNPDVLYKIPDYRKR